MAALSPEQGLSRLAVVLRGSAGDPDVTSVGVTGFCMGGTSRFDSPASKARGGGTI
jgi:dienelactone hydrolase